MASETSEPLLPARVVLLAGPSGCGKSHLAAEVGLPILALDDFYRADTDPAMPIGADGRVDWEDPTSWDGTAAADALERLCRTGTTDVPVYSIAENRAVGTRRISRDGAPLVVAEGIFAADLVAELRTRGLLADAILICENRWLTFARRLARDLREGRKAPWYLVRQGWTKTSSEPAVLRRQTARGARPLAKPQARARLADLIRRAGAAGEIREGTDRPRWSPAPASSTAAAPPAPQPSVEVA